MQANFYLYQEEKIGGTIFTSPIPSNPNQLRLLGVVWTTHGAPP